jgi:hypothetical protein
LPWAFSNPGLISSRASLRLAAAETRIVWVGAVVIVDEKRFMPRDNKQLRAIEPIKARKYRLFIKIDSKRSIFIPLSQPIHRPKSVSRFCGKKFFVGCGVWGVGRINKNNLPTPRTYEIV